MLQVGLQVTNTLEALNLAQIQTVFLTVILNQIRVSWSSYLWGLHLGLRHQQSSDSRWMSPTEHISTNATTAYTPLKFHLQKQWCQRDNKTSYWRDAINLFPPQTLHLKFPPSSCTSPASVYAPCVYKIFIAHPLLQLPAHYLILFFHTSAAPTLKKCTKTQRKACSCIAHFRPVL